MDVVNHEEVGCEGVERGHLAHDQIKKWDVVNIVKKLYVQTVGDKTFRYFRTRQAYQYLIVEAY
jgi:hypothetical protein